MKHKLIYQNKKPMNLFNGQFFFFKFSFVLLYRYLDRYLQRFQNELEQIELKNQIGQRQKTPQYASRKALIESTINTEQHEYETNGIGIRIFFFVCPKIIFLSSEIPNLTQIDAIKELR